MRVSDAIHVDRALARRILGGDERAFRGLFDSFFPRLYRFALARLNGDHEAALYTWFCQVCRNALIDYQRAMNREARTVVLLEDQPNLRAVLEAFVAPASAQPELVAWQQDVRRLVQATVDTLPDHYSAILEWKYVDGRSVDEIARQLNVGVKAAESLLTRARHAFREAIMALAETPDALRPPSEGG